MTREASIISPEGVSAPPTVMPETNRHLGKLVALPLEKKPQPELTREKQSFIQYDENGLHIDGYPQTTKERSIVEALFTQGSSILEIRGFLEEIQDRSRITRRTYIKGLFDKRPQPPDNSPQESFVPVWVNIPDPLPLRVGTRDEMFDPETSPTHNFSMDYPFNKRVVSHDAVWEDPQKRKTDIRVERFIDEARPNVIATRYAVTPHSSGELRFESEIDGNVENLSDEPEQNVKMLRVKGRRTSHDGKVTQLAAETAYRKHQIVETSRVKVFIDGRELEITPHVVTDEEGKVKQEIILPDVTAGTTVVVEKTVQVDYSPYGKQTSEELLEKGKDEVELLPDWEQLHKEHTDAYRKIDETSMVKIDGDPEAQAIVNAAVSQLTQSYGEGDAVVVAPRIGFMQETYGGRKFWEVYDSILRFYTLTQPDKAKRIVDSVYTGLDAARERAQEHFDTLPEEVKTRLTPFAKKRLERKTEDPDVRIGALVPWEAEAEGRDGTPKYILNPKTNELVEIKTGDMEIHNIATIARGIKYYVEQSGDEKFRRGKGLEILLETARFWGMRAEERPNGEYGYSHVISPDEWHEQGVTDSTFVNGMARAHLLHAISELQWLRGEAAADPKLLPDEEELDHWKSIAENMHMPAVNGEDITPQFEGWFDQPSFDLARVKRFIPAAELAEWLTDHGIARSSCQILKQADVVLVEINTLDPRRNPQDKTRMTKDLMYYDSNTAHESTLSLGISGLAYSLVGDQETARERLIAAGKIHLADSMRNSNKGVPTANAANIYRTVVEGFGGIHEGETLTVDPHLPSNWGELSIPVMLRGNPTRITATHENVHVAVAPATAGAGFPVNIRGDFHFLEPGDELEVPLNNKTKENTPDPKQMEPGNAYLVHGTQR